METALHAVDLLPHRMHQSEQQGRIRSRPIAKRQPQKMELAIQMKQPVFITLPPQPPAARDSRDYRLTIALIIFAIPGTVWGFVELWRSCQ